MMDAAACYTSCFTTCLCAVVLYVIPVAVSARCGTRGADSAVTFLGRCFHIQTRPNRGPPANQDRSAKLTDTSNPESPGDLVELQPVNSMRYVALLECAMDRSRFRASAPESLSNP
ncbi:hypothetical protein M8818_004057 [Zalaria obscura]|uniref:Uncharacterized protein n=1 Tax=Zalaria obscura TaxID=2024903 RepID=A0ACC3SCS4_9PEZI